MLLHLLVVGSLSCLSHFAAAQVINNTILDVPKETPGVAPAVLPQCVIGEEGCRGVQVMDLIDPVAWIMDPIDRTIHEGERNKLKLVRYRPDEDGKSCQGYDKRYSYGKEVHLLKNQCKTFHEHPIKQMSFNYVLSNNKIFDFCDITMFDGKECTGRPVYHLQASNPPSPMVINGQNYCHEVNYAKSIFVGPCS